MTEKQIKSFIKRNYDDMTNRQLADQLGLKLYLVRRFCHELGLKRMELEYFTKDQVTYLKRYYRIRGDKELSEIFQKKWPKKKPWTLKHIEKKRKYLKLRRTRKQIRAIHQRNVKAGRFKICPVKAWDIRGRAKEGEIRYWTAYKTGKKYPVIKHNGEFVHWARWCWERTFGKIPQGMNVVFKDCDTYNRSPENLMLISDSDLARLNSKKSSQGLSDNYIAGLLTHKNPMLRDIIKSCPGLIKVKRKQLTLNRTIYEQQVSKNP